MEKTYVCNMPEIATIELHQSNETGKYYFHFIGWTGRKETYGIWHDSEATEEEIKWITDMVQLNNAKELLDDVN